MSCLHPTFHKSSISTETFPPQVFEEVQEHRLVHQAIVRVPDLAIRHRKDRLESLAQVPLPCLGQRYVGIVPRNAIEGPISIRHMHVVVRAVR